MDKVPNPTRNTHENAPGREIEQKYLLGSKSDAEKLEGRVKQLYPDSRLVGAWSETSYYFPLVAKEKARTLLSFVVEYRPEEASDLLAKIDQIDETMPVSIRLILRKNREDKSFILKFKASANPLHDAERIEIETSDINENYLEGFAANGVEPESIWHSVRREYVVDENTKIDVQDVSGYGWEAEVEANNLTRVNEVAAKFGLQPLSKTLLNAMYRQYRKNWHEYYAGQGDNRHFSNDDWREIEKTSQEKVARNYLN